MNDQPIIAPQIDHRQCAPEAHDRSLPDGVLVVVEQNIAEDGLLACNDCNRPAFYCDNDRQYHHVDLDARCFLINS